MGRELRAVGGGSGGVAAEGTSRSSWPSVAGNACGVERRAVGSGQRSAVARAVGEVSAVSDLPPAFSAVGAQRQAGGGAEDSGASSARARQAEPRRSVRGCDLSERKKRGLAVGLTKRGKGTKIVALAAANSLPRGPQRPVVGAALDVSVQSASPVECKLIEEVLAGSFLDELPARLIGDKAYDSDALDRHLSEEYGIELISPNRRSRRRKTQDGRALRRYRKRWKVERLFAWLHNFRRLVTRWEYHIENFLGFVLFTRSEYNSN